MTTRATEDLSKVLIKNFTAGTGGSTQYFLGTLANNVVTACTAGQAADVCFRETQAAGARVSCTMMSDNSIVKVKVGTGGATGGSYAMVVADGVTNAPAAVAGAGGTVLHNIVGKFVEDGVAGDIVGMVPRSFVLQAAT